MYDVVYPYYKVLLYPSFLIMRVPLPSILNFFCSRISCCFLSESTAVVSSSPSLVFRTSSFCCLSQNCCMPAHLSTLSAICFWRVSIFNSSGPKSSPYRMQCCPVMVTYTYMYMCMGCMCIKLVESKPHSPMYHMKKLLNKIIKCYSKNYRIKN